MKTVPDDWQKSSRSTETNSCVEVSRARAAVRDSKNPTGPMLTVNLAAVLTAAKDGLLDRIAE
jgi:hypothetical protein